jgi:hypothetical protein
MSTTELDEVQALLERVLPDPTGFGQRLLLQAMARWGQSAEPGLSAFHSDARAYYTAATAEDVTASETAVTPDQPSADEMPVDTNMLLAAALGACECWGLRRDCHLCRGRGATGWVQPDLELFEEFVRPAIAKLSRISASGNNQHGNDEKSRNSQREG